MTKDDDAYAQHLDRILGDMTELRGEDPGVALGEAIELLTTTLLTMMVFLNLNGEEELASRIKFIVRKFHSLQLFPPV